MRARSHGWVGPYPLGHGSAATALCGKKFTDVVAVPLATEDIPVGGGVQLPQWVDCKGCRAKKIKRQRYQFVYCIRDSRDDRASELVQERKYSDRAENA